MYYMRTIVNISLPEAVAKEVRREVRAGGYASTSEFFREILRERQREALGAQLRAQRAGFNKKTWKRVYSSKDLG